jgi:ribonuclease D
MDPESNTQSPDKKKHNWRAQHRARAHESAHAEGEIEEAFAPQGLPLVPAGPAAMISDDQQLSQLIANLRADGAFAYDSEFIGELTYFPKLCVIQVASHARVALIDPLANLELHPFWELLADPAVEKIVHAGEQDLEPVFRHIGKPAANVIDTQIACGFIGLPYPMSLSKLVYEMTGAKLGKGLTFSHWDQRPLSAIQLRYAADDVRYLPAVRAQIGKRLDKLGHAGWAAQECAALCQTSQQRFDPSTQFLRIRGASALAPKNLAILRALTIWRDESAQKHDVPPRTFLRDEVLLDLARTPIKTVDRLNRVRGLPRPVENDYGTTIVELTRNASALPAEQLPVASRDHELSPPEKFKAESLFAAAQCICAAMKIDPALVTSRQEFGEFFRELEQPPAAQTSRLLQGWRREAIGEPLLRFLRGEVTADLKWIEETLEISWRR